MLDSSVLARKGGTGKNDFPHICPFSAIGADKPTCASLTALYQRNISGCVHTKCNSALRKCVKCIETGRGSNARLSTDPQTGLCEECATAAVAKPAATPARPAQPIRSGAAAVRTAASRVDHDSAARLSERHNAGVGTPARAGTPGAPKVPDVKPPPAQAGAVTKKALDGEVIPPAKGVAAKARWQEVLDQISRAMADAVYVKVDPASIRPLAGQPREYFDESDLAELSDSIADIGQIQPGIIRRVVRDGVIEYELLDGERRWRAVTRAHVSFYKAMLVDVQDDFIASFLIAAIANFNRADHTHMEISNAIERLRKGLDMPIEVIAKKFNITPHWAYQLHGLQKLHPRIQGLLDPKLPAKKRLPLQAGIEIAKIDATLQEGLVERFRRGEITLKTLRSEAVKASKSAGTYVRQREADQPARTLKKMRTQAEQLRRNAGDFKLFIEETDVVPVLKRSPKARAEVRAILQAAEETVLACRYALGDTAAQEA